MKGKKKGLENDIPETNGEDFESHAIGEEAKEEKLYKGENGAYFAASPEEPAQVDELLAADEPVSFSDPVPIEESSFKEAESLEATKEEEIISPSTGEEPAGKEEEDKEDIKPQEEAHVPAHTKVESTSEPQVNSHTQEEEPEPEKFEEENKEPKVNKKEAGEQVETINLPTDKVQTEKEVGPTEVHNDDG